MAGGLRDLAIPPWCVIDYYERTITAMGGYDETMNFFRFFEMPGKLELSARRLLSVQLNASLRGYCIS